MKLNSNKLLTIVVGLAIAIALGHAGPKPVANIEYQMFLVKLFVVLGIIWYVVEKD